MSRKMIVVSLLALLVPGFVSAVGPAGAPVLGLQAFVREALRNNAGLAALRAGYRQNMTQAGRVKAIRDIMLSAGTGFTSSDMVLSEGIPQGINNYKSFSTQISIGKKFPDLLGMTAGLSLSYYRTSYDYAGMGMDSATPGVALNVSVPLLRNFLGKIDRNTLKNSALIVRVLRHTENEAIENFIQSLIVTYIDWSLLVAKADIYQGITARAGGLYAQTLRKRNVGMADWSDVYLVQANYLRYQSLQNTTRLQAEQQYITLVSLMTGKRPDAASRVRAVHTPEQVTNRIIVDNTVRLATLRNVMMRQLQYQQSVLEQYSALNGKKPDLNLVLSAGRLGNGTDAGAAFGDFTKNQFYAGVEFNVSLQNTDKKLLFRAANEGVLKSAKELADTKRVVEYNLKNLRHSIAGMQDILKVTQRMETSNRLRLGAMFRKYSQGRVALSQVTDARDAYANSRIGYLEQRANLEKMYYSYLALTDRLLPRYAEMLRKGKK